MTSLRFLKSILVTTVCKESCDGFTEGDRYLFWDDMGDRYLHKHPGYWNCCAHKENFHIVSVQGVTTIEQDAVKPYTKPHRSEASLAKAEALAAQRQEARLRKDWETSDRLRDQILELGYRILDDKIGYRLFHVLDKH